MALFMLAVVAFAGGKAKYVFYFIGDGMGVNQVNGTETYLAAKQGIIGTTSLCFTQFPAVALITTQSATNGVTDSAAGGTALACASKTKNGVLGMLKDQTTSINSIAVWAQQAGAAVGISTTASIDHATPAAFYAHVPQRSMYYEIGKQMLESGFDFFAGSDFLEPDKKKDSEGSLYEQSRKAGYTIARGYPEYRNQRNAKKMILFQTEEASRKDRSSLPYAIDRQQGDLQLKEIAEAGIDFLTRQKKKGFFFMLEGGKIDWACHANDAAATFHEVVDMDEAIKVALEFYKKHPKETLIVVTADHETGGIALGRGAYAMNTTVLQYQRMSAEAYSAHLTQLCRKEGKNLSWQKLEDDLKTYWGFWDQVKLTDKQTQRLKEAALGALTHSDEKQEKSLYSSLNSLANTARLVMAETSMVGWQSGGHSNGYVPVFAIGAGAEKFCGKYDNTLIATKIAEAAGWKQK